MASNRTVIPGAQDGNDKTQLNHQGGNQNFDTQGYNPMGSGQNAGPGTRVPGMNNPANPGVNLPDQNIGKPIVGFLISVSRSDEGEFWVLRQGQNTIGSGSNCNIVLSEASVSSVHAVLAVHRNPGNNNHLSVGMLDKGSSNGTFVNGNYIGFNPCQCQNFDKIKIGNYELLLMLFDAADFKMAKAVDFVAKGSFDYTDRDMYPSNNSTRY